MPVSPESSRLAPRTIKAGNRGPFTLDGTRTFLVGRGEVGVIDPGPDVERHVRALISSLSGSSQVQILLTHHHGDHAGAAQGLSRALDAPVYGPPSTGCRPLEPGQSIHTDEGELLAVPTPGHTRDHLSLYWKDAQALFVGDLLLGRGSTTWLGEYDGCVADYLDSLDRVEALAPQLIYPAHGNPIRKVGPAIEAFREHRLRRLRQLRRAREAHPEAPTGTLLEMVYGKRLPERLLKAAEASIRVMLHHLDER